MRNAGIPVWHCPIYIYCPPTSAGFIERTTIIQRALRSLDVPVAALIPTKGHVHFLPTMRFLNTFLFSAASAVTVLAQTPQIAFTSVPAVVAAGSSYNITWGGGDGISVSSKLSARSPFLFLELIVPLAARHDHSAKRQPGQPPDHLHLNQYVFGVVA